MKYSKSQNRGYPTPPPAVYHQFLTVSFFFLQIKIISLYDFWYNIVLYRFKFNREQRNVNVDHMIKSNFQNGSTTLFIDDLRRPRGHVRFYELFMAFFAFVYGPVVRTCCVRRPATYPRHTTRRSRKRFAKNVPRETRSDRDRERETFTDPRTSQSHDLSAIHTRNHRRRRTSTDETTPVTVVPNLTVRSCARVSHASLSSSHNCAIVRVDTHRDKYIRI